MRIAIVGSGGVGGYFGGRLAAAGPRSAFSRGARTSKPSARAASASTVHWATCTCRGSTRPTIPSSIGPVDVVFFTVKLYDTDSALALLPPLIGADTVVVPFQNGVDSVDRLIGAVGRDTPPAAPPTWPP